MKLIEKLFARLGYVPREDYDAMAKYCKTCNAEAERYEKAQDDVYVGNVVYGVEELPYSFWVYCATAEGHDRGLKSLIKVLPFKDDNSKELARICAEELAEMLNQKY